MRFRSGFRKCQENLKHSSRIFAGQAEWRRLPDSEKDSEGLCLRSVEVQQKAGREQSERPTPERQGIPVRRFGVHGCTGVQQKFPLRQDRVRQWRLADGRQCVYQLCKGESQRGFVQTVQVTGRARGNESV